MLLIIHQYQSIFSVISSLKPILVRVAAASFVVVRQRSLLSAYHSFSLSSNNFLKLSLQEIKIDLEITSHIPCFSNTTTQAYWEIELSPYECEGEQMFPIVFTDSIFDKEIEKCDENNGKRKTKLITSLTEQYLASD